MNATKKYQVVPTNVVGESNYRKSVDKSLSLVVMPVNSEPIFDSNQYTVLTQEETSALMLTLPWKYEEEI
jgi:hypothetical protein